MSPALAPLRLHLVRHGRVDSHRGDMPLTAEGRADVEVLGARLGQALAAGELVTILHAPTRRTRETAQVLYERMVETRDPALTPPSEVSVPLEHGAIRNPDIYVAGTRVELVSSTEALAEQLPTSELTPEDLARLPFWRGFWDAPDRIGYWLGLADPPGEDAATVARRVLTFTTSLLDLPRSRPRRYVCVTHSPVMRALLRPFLPGGDPGEPEYAASVDLEAAEAGEFVLSYMGSELTVKGRGIG